MKLKLTKNNTIIFIVSIVGLSFILGFLVWRVNQKETVAPIEGEAGGGAGACCDPNVGCTAGWKCVSKSCDETESAIPCTAGASGCDTCGTGFRCRVLTSPSTSVCVNASTHTCKVTTTHTCVRESPDDPPSEGDCKNVQCEWPIVLMSGRNDPSQELCRCEPCTGKKAGNPWSCTGNPPTCNPSGCPSGYESCGTSVSHESGSNCKKNRSVYCVTYHPDCNNPSYIYRYCKPKEAPQENICTGGTWEVKPADTIDYGKAIPFKVKNTDVDGVEADSRSARLCTGSVSKCTSGTTKSTTLSNNIISGTLTGLAPGVYTLTVSWKDGKGNSGSACEKTTTFTVSQSPVNPDWSVSKSVIGECIDEDTPDPSAVLRYTIKVKNTGSGAGNVTRIEDSIEYNGDVFPSGLQSSNIQPSGSYSSSKTTWGSASFNPNEEKIYSYDVIVSKEYFGLYDNTVTVVVTEGDNLQASATIEINCLEKSPEEPIPEDTPPETGIFDTTLGRLFGGIFLVVIGVIIYSLPSGIFVIKPKPINYKYRDKFEKKMKEK